MAGSSRSASSSSTSTWTPLRLMVLAAAGVAVAASAAAPAATADAGYGLRQLLLRQQRQRSLASLLHALVADPADADVVDSGEDEAASWRRHVGSGGMRKRGFRNSLRFASNYGRKRSQAAANWNNWNNEGRAVN